MTKLEAAEARVRRLQARNVRLALRNVLTDTELTQLRRAYEVRNAMYCIEQGVTPDTARRHYALLAIHKADA